MKNLTKRNEKLPLIRKLVASDIAIIVDAFAKSNWTIKSASIFEQYLVEQNKEERIIWVAYVTNKFVGYVTLQWTSKYQHFVEANIPEISDLNVLPDYRNSGIGSMLLDKCEENAAAKSNIVGIGVGLYADYGMAQRLYVKRGYIPDGHGITYNYQATNPGKKYCLDDDLILWFTKDLTYTQNK